VAPGGDGFRLRIDGGSGLADCVTGGGGVRWDISVSGEADLYGCLVAIGKGAN
jgi:hypothetical protein